MTLSFWQPPASGRAGVTRIGVDVTFLRLDALPPEGPALPQEVELVRVAQPTVGFYRYLYNSVGAAYCWWLRRVAPDAEIAALLAHPLVSIHVLYKGGEPAGFFELDGRGGSDVNLSYFGLMPHMVGQRVGPAFLRAAVEHAVAASRDGTVRVNTCTADHPRALATYERAGFRKLRTLREVWDIPNHLELTIPDHLRL